MDQSGISEEELESESEWAIQTGCLDLIKPERVTTLALCFTLGMRFVMKDHGNIIHNIMSNTIIKYSWPKFSRMNH